jgi:hypothetical protein
MSPLRDALTQYVSLRRALGTKLEEPAQTLGYFLVFFESKGSKFISTKLALCSCLLLYAWFLRFWLSRSEW